MQIRYSFQEISTSFTKQRFKNLVKKQCELACFRSLMKEKNKLSKGREIKYKEHKMQSYMKPGSGLAPDTARKIFSLRSRDLQIRGNFPNSHEDLSCVMPLCQERETQEHLWSCSFLAPENVIVQQDLQYNDIFSEDVRKQELVMEIIFQRFQLRNKNCGNRAREPGGRSSSLHLVITEARRGTRRKKQ